MFSVFYNFFVSFGRSIVTIFSILVFFILSVVCLWFGGYIFNADTKVGILATLLGMGFIVFFGVALHTQGVSNVGFVSNLDYGTHKLITQVSDGGEKFLTIVQDTDGNFYCVRSDNHFADEVKFVRPIKNGRGGWELESVMPYKPSEQKPEEKPKDTAAAKK